MNARDRQVLEVVKDVYPDEVSVEAYNDGEAKGWKIIATGELGQIIVVVTPGEVHVDVPVTAPLLAEFCETLFNEGEWQENWEELRELVSTASDAIKPFDALLYFETLTIYDDVGNGWTALQLRHEARLDWGPSLLDWVRFLVSVGDEFTRVILRVALGDAEELLRELIQTFQDAAEAIEAGGCVEEVD